MLQCLYYFVPLVAEVSCCCVFSIQGETVYAGFNRAQGSYTVGPLCRYTSTPASEAVLGDCQSELGDYQAILVGPESSCGQGTLTNTFTWTPDSDTPDLVYYQVLCVCVCVFIGCH